MNARKRRRLLVPSLSAAALSLVVAGCADVGSEPTGPDLLPTDRIQAAEAKAAELVAGQDLSGTTVSFIGTWGGDERERMLASLAPFEEATGITIQFTGTADREAVIQTNIEAGTPIDVAQVSPGPLRRHVEAGSVYDLNELVGEDVLRENFSEDFLATTSFDGGNYGVWSMVDNYMLWYNPHTYSGPTGADTTWDDMMEWSDATAASGTAPWCMGLSSGATTGWPGAYMAQHLLIKQAGPDFVERLAAGEESWDSPEVRDAFELFGAVVANEDTVYGGPSGILSADPGSAHNGMYADPPLCEVEHWGTWTASMILSADPTLQPVTDIDFLPLPAVTAEYAGVDGYDGSILSAFSDRPEVAAFMGYVSSAEHADLIAATGNWIPANSQFDQTAFPNELLANIYSEIVSSERLVMFPLNAASPDLQAQLYLTTSEFVQDPSTLDANLAQMDALSN